MWLIVVFGCGGGLCCEMGSSCNVFSWLSPGFGGAIGVAWAYLQLE